MNYEQDMLLGFDVLYSDGCFDVSFEDFVEICHGPMAVSNLHPML